MPFPKSLPLAALLLAFLLGCTALAGVYASAAFFCALQSPQ